MIVTNYNPDRDIPDLSGKVILVTGGTAGLGKSTILALIKHHPEHVYFSGRDAEKATAIISSVNAETPGVKITFLQCDLTSLASVEQASKQFIAQSQRLDILMCNAGIMATPPGLTKDGYELQFGTNHVGHALLMKLLVPTLLQTAAQPGGDARIVCNTSLAAFAPGATIKFDDVRTTQEGFVGHWTRYSQSKLANLLYTTQLARHYPSITTVSIHPGVINTGLVSGLGFWDNLLVKTTNPTMLSEDQGSYNQLWAATSQKENVVSGQCYLPVGISAKRNKVTEDTRLAEKLWQWTQKELVGYKV